jgi:dynein light intermediate chain|mmetsp:Transcript_28920/g.49300  ORF Transcript_28920/g.49300 Transcript_28920/m.49300 type:complete len:243 (-) Transcript_28920:73-801(-)|eukprot:CAMPEP_0174289006 /NCGR_PEP_ID=MMETSP0809-20121228/23194_1 /TAXON_ID=73025 ORGANISM="Eutreptiella gymnastica-like, Strain CCMP1594" /NCGR_SAMPLE_ID=MMETSP0809 /ASSEMBLY_ACC=CAM_ASM_000658 /LENGTH=242 /DNA_ID=CAMNT_0015386657 /DNA_START=25 /DNA_END=753 /DNA_ORIENTATION=+
MSEGDLQTKEDSLITWDSPYAPQDAKKTSKLRQKKDLPPFDTRPQNPAAQEVIDRFILPKTWEEDDAVWIQKASAQPATRLEVVTLQEKLNSMLHDLGAKDTGICPVRKKLYAECFDEVIRQVTAECVERGLLLLRVRDERRATVQAYQTLFESRMGYGFRLALKGEQEILENMHRIQTVADAKEQLEKQCEEWKAKIEKTLKEQEERFKEDDKKYADEINSLKKENQAKKIQLENCCLVKK